MSKYQEKLTEIKGKIDARNKQAGKKTSAVSKSDLNDLAHTLLNTPEHEVNVYSGKVVEGKPEYTTTTPVKKYRESLKPMLKDMGIDKNDLVKVEDVNISKEHAAAMMDVSSVVVHDYLKAGRKYSFPIMAEDEAKMEILHATAEEKESTNKFAKDDNSVTVTKERAIIKAKNAVPVWLKYKK